MPKRIALQPLLLTDEFGEPNLPAPYGSIEKWTWTQSALKLFRRCPRKFFWRYVMGLRPKTKSASLWIGTLFHQTVARWISQKRVTMERISRREIQAMDEELQDTMSLYDQEELEKLQGAMAMFAGMCMGYAQVHASDREIWRIDRKLVEKEFSIDFGDFEFQGSIDQIVTEKKTGHRLLVERKTASTVTESYIDRLALDTQTRGYLLGAERSGLPCKKVVYDVTRKSKLRRKANEDQLEYEVRVANDYFERPEFYFVREELRFSKKDLAAFEHEARQTHAAFMHLLESAEDPTDPRAWSIDDQECNAYFRMCEYHQLCLRGLDQGASAIFNRAESMHPELEQGEAK